MHNAAAIRNRIAANSSPTKLIAVVKADAYGHGAVQAARVLREAGVDYFAVTTSGEALELRDAGVDARLLAFAPPSTRDEAASLLESEVEVTVADVYGLKLVSDTARAIGKAGRVHLKVDTGMGRLGFGPTDATVAAMALPKETPLSLAGVYTHFGRALEPDFGPTRKQFSVFESVLSEIESKGIDPGLRHCANSAAMLRDPSMWLDAVRVGTLLYGQYPSASVPKDVDLKNTWQMKTRVISVRTVHAGTAIGYGAEFVTKRRSTLAVLAIGYADGFTMAPASTMTGWRGIKALLRRQPALVTVRGQKAPVIGRVAMQMCTVDVTDVNGVEAGEVVDVPCRRLAASARIPRVYRD